MAAHFNLEPHHSVGLTLRSYPFYRKAKGILEDPSVFERYYHPDQPARYARNFEKKCERLRRQAVTETVPGLLADGRYLPCLDNRPRSNVPLVYYRLYRRLLEEIAGGR